MDADKKFIESTIELADEPYKWLVDSVDARVKDKYPSAFSRGYTELFDLFDGAKEEKKA
jgi:hypothetical protein